jgi:hypothetical protein
VNGHTSLVIDMIVVMNRIALILERRRRLLSLRYPRLSATGCGKHTAVEVALARHKDSFMADDNIWARIPYCGADESVMKSRGYAAAKRSRARCFKGQDNARGNSLAERSLARKDKLISTSLLSDQRGAVAFEMLIVWLFLMLSLLLPLADVAIAGFQFVSAWQALRAFGQYVQLHPPPDVTNTGVWKSTLPTTVTGYPISNIQIGVDGPIMYYSYTTTVTLLPFNFLKTMLCKSSNPNPCSFTLSYSERFQ